MTLGFEEYLLKTNNIYDLIAVCFGLLCDEVSNHQAFIGEYLSEGEGNENNPNIETLNQFAEEIMEIVSEYEMANYVEIRKRILEAIAELELIDYQDELQNRLTVVYHIISAIDALAMTWEMHWTQASLGPLNTSGQTKYSVYFSPRDTIHSQYVEGVGRDRIGSSDFFEHFKSFRFVDERKWKKGISIPQIQLVRFSKEQAQYFREVPKIKIAVLPVACKKNFEFVEKRGAGVKVDYATVEQDILGEYVCQCISTAIEQGAHIIILPEYTVSPEISEKIKECLEKVHREKWREIELLLVFAGSTWTKDDNNVMQIFDTMGNIVGEYYKYSPFTKRDGESQGFSSYEAIANPGKICNLVAIEQIGIILPAICRDVIDGEYTEEIAKMLLPTLVAIAAWSPSVASFEPRLAELANKYFSNAVLCNACSAIKREKEIIGSASIVSKKESIAGNMIGELKRENCVEVCGSKPCIYFLEYDFTFEPEARNTQLTYYKYDAK